MSQTHSRRAAALADRFRAGNMITRAAMIEDLIAFMVDMARALDRLESKGENDG